MSSAARPSRVSPQLLHWTGGFIALAGVQFLVPAQFLAQRGLVVGDVTGLFYAPQC